MVDAKGIHVAHSIVEYIDNQVEFFELLVEVMGFITSSKKQIESRDEKSVEKLIEYNKKLYVYITPERYENSFLNPSAAAKAFGLEAGRLLSVYAAEFRAAIPVAYAGDADDLSIRYELFDKASDILRTESKKILDGKCEISGKACQKLHDVFYEYLEKNMEKQILNKLTWQLVSRDVFSGPSDEISLYETGEYVSDNEIKMYRFLSELPDEKLQAMADTFIGGYVKGFEVTGRDLSIKETAELRFNIGFLPMIHRAIDNLEKVNIKPTYMRAGYSIFTGRSVDKNGFFGANPNPQFDYDHKDDLALFLDEKLNNLRLKALKKAFKKVKKNAKLYAGPAVIDIFGEEMFEPVNKAEAVQHSKETRNLLTQYASAAGQITNEFIPGEERSFTIIAFPMPSIGDNFKEIFEDTIKINTLDYTLYRDMQQKMIDILDTAEYVYVRGKNNNKTDLKIKLHKLDNPSKQTNFENCVADVNIPVGEVFTSPLLTGTKGVLNVCKVFLNGLEYRNLTIKVEDGMIADYSCDNYTLEDGSIDVASGKKMIEDNILFHHDTLPMGECAIGTNTYAFEAARRYGIEAQMPILIAEKTGPHFAFGDTCYSHSEDLPVFNPDGKEIIARDNECSLLRKKDMSKAYFSCHTDITIPYDELDEVSALLADGTKIPIILDGRFAVEGCEILNEPLDRM